MEMKKMKIIGSKDIQALYRDGYNKLRSQTNSSLELYEEIRKKEEGVRMEAYTFLSLSVADLQYVTDGFYEVKLDEDEFLGVDPTDVLVVGGHVLRDQFAVKSISKITWKRHDQALLRSPQMDQYIST
ncbi:hypothetical protein Tco_0898468 [Tanacetum coccineum]